MNALRNSLLELIRRTSAELPNDVVTAIRSAAEQEQPGSLARRTLDIILQNAELARQKSQPICQDTGTINFYVQCPLEFDMLEFEDAAKHAVRDATRKGYLRQNSVDPVTGAPDPENTSPGTLVFHFDPRRTTTLEVRLLLKGGGCENVSAQYSLPDARLGANRDLDGCRKAILDGVFQAQGKGCSPGVIGVCIGAVRATGYALAKHQLLRNLDDTNPVPELAALERQVVLEANRLGIGPMGFGGRTTLLGAKICAAHRLPASFFVSISYICWAYRRQGVRLDSNGQIIQWLY
ncbi:MAG: fumarate hydratase [Verrucomicrobiae bacterium]|nr:fumarate hydratase [Verrucomicrobiae bacterium]